MSVHIDRRPIVSDVDLTVEPGQIVGLIGPNGSGKSTLLRTLYRVLRPATGAVRLNGDDLWKLRPQEVARRRAAVAQDHAIDADFLVRDVVVMGRTPHKRLLDREDGRDRRIVDEALDRVRMGWAAERVFTTLSGGERQRVLLARALAQQAPLLILDEPTNHLDVRAQLELLELVSSLGLTTLTALHDLDHAASYCDRLVLLEHGRVRAAGTPTEVLLPALLASVFGVRAHLGVHPLTGRLHVCVAPLPPADDVRALAGVGAEQRGGHRPDDDPNGRAADADGPRGKDLG
ncbi:ABC transporter ATP-binding protein [Micromonospora pallida]|uniref:ABC transporter ATP-binding protein n=1 Tax=Micromonospora pallida TaxID=145854 RepID=UPI001FE190CD|nr:ABC transporter ATP-binding protein [Micromonospora pallida]